MTKTKTLLLIATLLISFTTSANAETSQKDNLQSILDNHWAAANKE